MGTSFIPLCVIIAVLIIAFLFASLPQVNHKTQYRVLYAIAIIMLLAVIPISEYMAGHAPNSSNNYLLVLIFDIAVGYFCMYIAALLKELEWLADKIKMFTEEEQKAILASACAFTEHGFIVTHSITIHPKDTCSQQELMYPVCSAFFNMGKKCNDIISFLYKIFPLYFPAGKSVLAKKSQDWIKLRREGRKKNK